MSKSQEYKTKFSKVDLTLVSANANETEARVLMLGDSKYEKRDYLKQPDYDLEAMKALLRHVGEIMKGRHYDEESGQSHLAHVRANTGIILECWAFHNIEPGENWPHEPAAPKPSGPPAWVDQPIEPRYAKEEVSLKGFAVVKSGSMKGTLVPQGRDCIGPDARSHSD